MSLHTCMPGAATPAARGPSRRDPMPGAGRGGGPGVGLFHKPWRMPIGERRGRAAEAECRLACDSIPSWTTPMNLLGLIHLDRGEPEPRLSSSFRPSGRGRPADGLINAAVALNDSGTRAGRGEQRQVLQHSPRNPLAWTNLGMALRGLGRREEARSASSRRATTPCQVQLGYVHLQEDDLRRGLPLLEARRRVLSIGHGLDGRPWSGGERPTMSFSLCRSRVSATRSS